MDAMDKVDEVESLMVDGSTVRIPNWTGGDSQQNDNEGNVRSLDTLEKESTDCLINNIVKVESEKQILRPKDSKFRA